jgi:alpha-mannosidase
MRLDIPLGMMRPDRDQLPGACKNWFTAGRWLDVANRDVGITWATLDAPLVEIGGLTARLLGSQTNPAVWRDKIERAQTFYSWVMNNHWGTNYRAYQEGPVTFRYALRPHRKSTPDAAARFATGLSQPLIAARAAGQTPAASRFLVEPDDVIVLGVKPSDDNKATILRLFGGSGKDALAKISWLQPKQLWLSDTSERRLQPLPGTVPVPAWEVVTVRAE